MKNVIYKATCHTTGKCYVGQTSREFDVRKGEHIKAGSNSSNNAFHNAIYQYGADDFTWEILETLVDETKLLAREIYWSYQEHAYIPEGYSPVPGALAGSNTKPVVCLETGDVFTSAGEAAKWAGLQSSGISEALKNGTPAGFVPETTTRAHWDYANPLHRARMEQKWASKGKNNANYSKSEQNNTVFSNSEAVLLKQIEFLQAQVEYLTSRLKKYENI